MSTPFSQQDANSTTNGVNNSVLANINFDVSNNLKTADQNLSGAISGGKLQTDIFTLLNGIISSSKLAISTALDAVVSGGRLLITTAFDSTIGTINTNIATLVANTPALSGGNIPVVLPSAQITTLTPPAAITNFAKETGGNLAILSGIVSNAKAAVSTALDAVVSGGRLLITTAFDATIGTINTNIATLVTNTPALSSGSSPVILPTSQITTLTPPAAVAPPEMRYNGAATAALNNNLCQSSVSTSPLGCQGYSSIILQINASAGITGGVISFEASEDIANYVALPMLNIATGIKVTSINLTAGQSYFFIAPVSLIYFKAVITTAIVGGTATCYTRQSPMPMSDHANYIAG